MLRCLLSRMDIASPNPGSVYLSIVRWKRKPRKPFWLGTAKSKIFYIPETPVQSLEEYEGLKRLYQLYRTSIKSIRKFLVDEVNKNSSVELKQSCVNEEEIKKSYEQNQEWNLQCAKFRETRLAEERKKNEEIMLNIIETKEMEEKQKLAIAETLVKAEAERASSYITPENIDSAIEECLSQTVNYDYAIDLDGNIHKGFDSSSKLSNESDVPKLVQERSSAI